MLKSILDHRITERAIIALILVNAVTLGLETSPSVMARWGDILHVIDRAILAIFVIELVARMIVHRLAFFRDPWSLFDLFVVGIALVPATGSLSVLRALRVLRVLRLITVIPSLKRVVGGLVAAMPGMGSILLLLLLIFYVFSVMATKLFGATSPENFGTLGATAYSLFQVMTFDDWSNGIVKPLMEAHAYAIVFFVVFILMSTFMALNLFIGVVVNAIDMEQKAEDKAEGNAPATSAEVARLRRDIAELKTMMERGAPVDAGR